MTTLKIGLSWLSHKFPADSEDQDLIHKKIQSMSTLVGNTVLKVQRISSELRPSILDDVGLVAAMKWLARDFQNRTKIKCREDLEPINFALDPECTIAIYRIMQEALTNVARHSQATQVSVSLKRKKKNLELRIRDNGKGIDERDITSSESLGIIGMRERILPFGAKLRLSGTPNKGTTVSVSFPIERIKRS